ncbi:MAG TPA: hypothetical protein VJ649_05490, partial [Actinomycetes bacterium]|nr:hypothetical protein [Actinomycetes bacterium]
MRQLFDLEVHEPGPQGQVRRVGRLSVERNGPLDRRDGGQLRSNQQELALQSGPIQRAQVESLELASLPPHPLTSGRPGPRLCSR